MRFWLQLALHHDKDPYDTHLQYERKPLYFKGFRKMQVLPSLTSAGLLAARLGFVNRKSDAVWGERAASGWEFVSADAWPSCVRYV